MSSKKRKLTLNQSDIDKLKRERDDYKEKYERLLFEKEYTDQREVDSGLCNIRTSQYISDGGEAWDIVSEKYWFKYNTCKNPICQDDGMDWFTGKFYCDEDCEQEAKVECQKIRQRLADKK